MNRRSFAQTLAGTMAGAYGFAHSPDVFSQESMAPANPAVANPDQEVSGAPFQLSVMLWTVFTDLPFEQRLEKVAEAGYRNVELVGEYDKSKLLLFFANARSSWRSAGSSSFWATS